ncbi:pre-mRNA-splicing factorsyf2 [Porites harrisoni]
MKGQSSKEASSNGIVIEKDVAGPSSSSSSTAEEKRAERMKRLRELHLRRNEARKLNHQEVVEEDRRKKLPANWDAMQRKTEWENKEEDARKEAEAHLRGRGKKKNPDQGFSGYAAAQYRQYQRLTKQMKPSVDEYSREKDQKGEAMYPSVDDVTYGGQGKVPEAAVDRMVADLEKQIQKREKYSRRRAHLDEEDIDYINERNMKFNQKLARFYDPFTAEIKQNLERGTAI